MQLMHWMGCCNCLLTSAKRLEWQYLLSNASMLDEHMHILFPFAQQTLEM